MIDSLNSILATGIRVRIVEAGVNSVDMERCYSQLVQSGEASLIGFEQSPEALAALNRKNQSMSAISRTYSEMAGNIRSTPAPHLG